MPTCYFNLLSLSLFSTVSQFGGQDILMALNTRNKNARTVSAIGYIHVNKTNYLSNMIMYLFLLCKADMLTVDCESAVI